MHRTAKDFHKRMACRNDCRVTWYGINGVRSHFGYSTLRQKKLLSSKFLVSGFLHAVRCCLRSEGVYHRRRRHIKQLTRYPSRATGCVAKCTSFPWSDSVPTSHCTLHATWRIPRGALSMSLALSILAIRLLRHSRFSYQYTLSIWYPPPPICRPSSHSN